MLEELKKELIIDHFNNPVNKGLTNDETYKKANSSNPSCIDHFTIELKIEDNSFTKSNYSSNIRSTSF